MSKLNEGIEMKIPKSILNQQDSALRVRSFFDSAQGVKSSTGMHLVLYTGEFDKMTVISQSSSLDNSVGENMVSIDVSNLNPNYDYTLRYEFFERQYTHVSSSLSQQEDVMESGSALVKCNLPYFTQEFSLVDKKVSQKRVKKYQKSPPYWEDQKSKLSGCFDKISALDGSEVPSYMESEGGFDCSE